MVKPTSRSPRSPSATNRRPLTTRFARAALLAWVALVCNGPPAAGADGFATYQPATVDPPVARPATAHCSVTILREQPFKDFFPAKTTFTPPAACAGQWSKVVLDFDTHVRGVQYDRIGELWIGRDEILRFSTAEPTKAGIRYHVEKDVTAYAPLFRSRQPVTTLLGNLVNKKYTGIFYVTATLTFYESGAGAPAARTADRIIAIDGTRADQADDESGHLRKALSALPRNIVRAHLDLYATNHGCDEFWYSNQPDAYATAHKRDGLCGGSAYREIDVRIDGRLANVVYPFPYIWTGGINPLLWRPLSAIHTLDVPSYDVDLDPWAGVLSDGRPHTVSISVYDDRGDWPIDGNLMLWLDPRAQRTGGAIVDDAIPAQPVLASSERATASGDKFWLAAQRAWHLSGYVNTSGGRITYGIADAMHFSNVQLLDLATGLGDATQDTTFLRTTSVTREGRTSSSQVTTSYPLIANSVYPPPAKSKPYSLVIDADVRQELHVHSAARRCDEVVSSAAVLKRITVDMVSDRDAVARGRTSESNACAGDTGTFSIRKSAVDGTLVQGF